MATVPLKFYKTTVNGVPSYEVFPSYNTPRGYTSVDDLAEVRAELTKVTTGPVRYSENYVNQLEKGLRDIEAGSSPYVTNDKGILATQQEVASQQVQQQAIASGQVKNIGTAEAPLTVPTGTPNPKTVTFEQSLAGPAGKIPGVQPSKAVEPAPQPQVMPGQPSLMEGGSYTVMPGDTLSAIAKKLGVPITSITGYRSGNPNLIYPGEKLSVMGTGQPTGGTTPPATGTTGANTTGSAAPAIPSTPTTPETPTTPPPAPPSPGDFTKIYTDTLDKLGISSIKSQFDKVQKDFDDLQNELNDKLIEIDDNPWISEGLRTKQRKSLTDKYEGRLNIKTNQLKLYDSLYQQGIAEARYLTTGEESSKEFAIEQARKGREAAEKLVSDINSGKYKNIKEVNGGLYDLDSDSWIVPPKADDGGYKPPTSYQEWELAGGKEGTGKTYSEWVSASNVKPATVAQQTVATYAARIEQANPIIDNLENSITGMNPLSFEAQIRLPSYIQSANMQSYMQAARNFVNAVLRRESGAVISPSEFDNAYNQYLPRPGDSEQTLQQKRTNRDIVYKSFVKGSGTAYQSVDELLGGGSITDPLGLGF